MFDPNLDPVRYDRDRRRSSNDQPHIVQDAPISRTIIGALLVIVGILLLISILSFASSDNDEASTQADSSAVEQSVIQLTQPAE